jgi:23S rRNA (cytidine1920-2'-O)/16S rRNA (cytidine1409-2'-O)-methyltransferase
MNKKIAKIRLDQLLVMKGLVENASKARSRIMAGDVIVNDHVADKAGEKFADSVDIRLRGNSHPYVSRGGVKLEHAINTWPFLLADAVAIDVGASTGGFSQVLLQHGVKRVFAVDVGYGQLAEPLRQDPRIVNLERTHILHIDKTMLSDIPNIAVIDVSFISLKKILIHVKSLLSDDAMIYALVKPQFEAGREHIAKGGIVKDPAIHALVLEDIKSFAKEVGLTVLGATPSPILGAKGNVEFLVALSCQLRLSSS